MLVRLGQIVRRAEGMNAQLTEEDARSFRRQEADASKSVWLRSVYSSPPSMTMPVVPAPSMWPAKNGPRSSLPDCHCGNCSEEGALGSETYGPCSVRWTMFGNC